MLHLSKRLRSPLECKNDLFYNKWYMASSRNSKILNRNTIKVSYSCIGNMKSLINRHNAKILQTKAPAEAKGCNCRKNSTCPLNRACLTESLVYKATVLAENHEPQTYIGMTEHNVKTRIRNHKMSFENSNYSSSMTLSKYIWDLKDEETSYEIMTPSTLHCFKTKTILFCSRPHFVSVSFSPVHTTTRIRTENAFKPYILLYYPSILPVLLSLQQIKVVPLRWSSSWSCHESSMF